MALSDRIEQLEGEVTTRVEEALRELRDDLRERLRAGEEDALRRLDELAERIPRGLLNRQDVEPIARGAGDEGRREAWGDLLEGLAAIDSSDGQADALNARRDAYNSNAMRANDQVAMHEQAVAVLNREIARYNLMVQYPDGLDETAMVKPPTP